MNEENINNTTYLIDNSVLAAIHATPEESWVDFILGD